MRRCKTPTDTQRFTALVGPISIGQLESKGQIGVKSGKRRGQEDVRGGMTPTDIQRFYVVVVFITGLLESKGRESVPGEGVEEKGEMMTWS